MSRYRFALRPKWILSHIFVLSLVVIMINLGIWQLHRLQEKRDRNARVTARSEEPVAQAGDLAAPGQYGKVGGLEFRRATATGTYLGDQQVLVRGRSNDSAPGSWVLTPLRLSDGTALVVNRGWISNSGEYDAVPKRFAAPTGEVTVTGLVRETETRGSFGSVDPKTGTLTDLARADVARLDQQVDEDLLPYVLQLQVQKPAIRAADPEPVPAPALDEGPHLSYALQWFSFSLMTLIIYPLILRRRAREIEREERNAALDAAAADEAEPDGGDPEDGAQLVSPAAPTGDPSG
ncbi:SURF1 family protein [Aquihabitans sp. McL0605]|uniref:SURF1 family cytochrome oxidase biogenesis protein n=1 Tax=Aquihabitans sp. McL0605 TaxID=3415671 RepID=UPI003CF4A627